MDIEDVLASRLRPLMMRMGPYVNVLSVVERVFQRAPDIVKEFKDAMEDVYSTSQIVKKTTLVDLVCEKVLCNICYCSLFS